MTALRPEDLSFSLYPAPPAGGMRVGMPNGVTVTHKPSGLAVSCGSQRSQHRNRDLAMTALAAALEAIKTPSAPAAPSVGEPMTPALINSLPQPVRDYIHALSANTDPAGMVRENTQLRDTNEGLQRMYRRAADALAEVIGCFDAAAGEGLAEALAETPDKRLKDLVERRLMYAHAAALNLATPPAATAVT